jgi:glycosyltransferase involved in cell wall biosynthesis
MCATPGDGAVEYVAWDERESADDFVRRVDVLVGLPDIRLLRARGRTGRALPYLVLVMGNATRGVPFAGPIMDLLQPNDTLVTSCATDIDVLRMFLEVPTDDSVDRAPMPSDLSAFEPRVPTPDVLTAALGAIGYDRPAVLSAERFNKGKSVHRVIPVAEQLHDYGHRPTLIFLGAGSDAAAAVYQREVVEELSRRGLADGVVFLPFLDAAELASVYARSTFVLSVSTIYDNNFGYVPIETMVAGTPPIATDWGGYRDTVIEGVTGVRIPTLLRADGSVEIDSAPAVREASALLDDRVRYDAMVAAGRRHTEDGFSVDASRRIYARLAATAVARDVSTLRPWKLTELAHAAIASGWTDQTDNADRTARVSRGVRPRTAEFDAIRQAIYAHYATRVEEES